jgi:hypothetical protein
VFLRTKKGEKKMTNQVAEQSISGAAGCSPAVFMEVEIKRLKRRLKEKQARSHSAAQWEGMIEDCEVLLKHLESKPR